MRGDPTTVGALLRKLRRMLGHLGTRDRETVLEAIDAIFELTERLHAATHPAEPTGAVTITPVADDAPADTATA